MVVRWTPEQVAAITSRRDTLLAASAGTGKTTTIVGKILWSLGLDVGTAADGTPIPPCPDPCRLEEIAAITFTEKAAHDLQTKLRTAIEVSERGAELRWELERATVGTIHSFAADLLREHALRLDIDPTFRIVDAREAETRQEEVVREVVADALRDRDPGAVELTKRYGLTGWRMWPGAVGRIRDVMRDLRWRAHQFDDWSHPVEGKRHTRELDREGLARRAEFAGHGTDDPDARDRASLDLSDTLYRLGRTSVGAWLTWLERENARDFDSLILDARRLLSRRETSSALEEIRRRLRLLVIDEFQDTDRAQWDIARAIAALAGAAEGGPAAGEAVPGGGRTLPAGEEGTRSARRPPAPGLVLVGDPKQSIYRFRGADVGVWNEARAALESDGTVLDLSWNFRSEPRLVAYVNRVGETALGETARALAGSAPESVVPYRPLEPARVASPAAGLEWLAVERASVAERREEEARRVAGRLHDLIDRVAVVDPDDGTLRRCRASDIAILGRRNDDLAALEPGLSTYGIPFYNAATSGLSNRQEVLDLVTALRIIENPVDDLRAFAWLRSPFVGLRDEILARLALDGDAPVPDRASPSREPSILQRAERFLQSAERDPAVWFEAPEGAEVAAIERAALARGLDALAEAQALADRADHAELLNALLDRTGYRDHLVLRDGASETLANIERFLALLEEYRHLTLVRFLALWDRWGEQDLGIPQARLFSSGDDVVTLSTIHAAKGLEWPIVFLVGTTGALAPTGRFVGTQWMDPELGPVFLPKSEERGPRAEAALARRIAQERAEEARLLYVATTRARDRLVVVGPLEPAPDTFAAWLGVELADAREAYEIAGEAEDVEPPDRLRRALRARADDAVTGTGRQIDAFGEEEPQIDLFDGPSPAGAPGRAEAPIPMVIRRQGASLQTSLTAPPVTLDWIRGVEPGVPAGPPARVPETPHRLIGSATEHMLRDRDPAAWSRRYEHGVLGPEEFLADAPDGDALTPAARGTLIHGVLERIRAEEELSRVLDETIASLDMAELELDLEPGSRYREALEREIASVVRSPEWHWYVEGRHYRELRFLHRGDGGWTGGAFDLLRPAAESSVPAQVSLFDGPLDGRGGHHLAHWVIDFKTHRIPAAEAGTVAERYRIQADVYRRAAATLLDAAEPPRVALHFTHPNVAVEL